jgi:hypothetical protein
MPEPDTQHIMQPAPAHPDVPRRAGAAVDDAVARTVAVGGLSGIALIHVVQSPNAFAETTYLGVLFIGAIVASLALSAILTRTSDPRMWAATGGLAALILLGYVLSRTSGLPDATDDIGDWSEPLGLASLVVEGLLVCLTAAAVATRRRGAGKAVGRPIEPEGRRRFRRATSGLVAETRPEFKRVDVSPARPDDGSWLRPRS